MLGVVRRLRPIFTLDNSLRLLVAVLFLGAVVLIFVPRVPVLLRAGVFVFACVSVLGLKRLRPAAFEAPKPRLEVDAEGVRRVIGNRTVERVRWDRLVEVSIVTTDAGPYAEDFFWLLRAADGSGCAVPDSLAHEVDLLARLQRLPRFDNEAVIHAVGSTSQARFPCWTGSPGEGLAAIEAERDGRPAG